MITSVQHASCKYGKKYRVFFSPSETTENELPNFDLFQEFFNDNTEQNEGNETQIDTSLARMKTKVLLKRQTLTSLYGSDS